MKKQKSRKATPWEEDNGLTATQAFLKQHYELHYENHHRKVGDSYERVNSLSLFTRI